MEKINLLDCTLRDGGYINDWRFGKEAIADMTEKLADTHVEVLEIGFLKDEPYQKDRTVFNSMEQVKKLIAPKKPGVQYAVMCEVVNPLPLDMLDPADGDSADIIRVIVWKTKHDSDGNVVDALDEGFAYCKGIVEKGYKLCVQPARVDQYTDEEFVAMVRRFAQLNPMAIYVVDSWGTQNPENLLHYMHLADENMDQSILLGYHGHNNMMQALSVSQAMIKEGFSRDIMIDASVYGIGRGAGNLNLEIIAKYLNEHYGKAYEIMPMLDVYDKYIAAIYRQEAWGYSIPYYLTAKYNCNPNYAKLVEKYKDINLSLIEGFLQSLNETERLMYNEKRSQESFSVYLKKNKSFAIVIPVESDWDVVETALLRVLSSNRILGADIVLLIFGAEEDSCVAIKNYELDGVHIFYQYFSEETNVVSVCKETCEELAQKYDYIWLARDFTYDFYTTIRSILQKRAGGDLFICIPQKRQQTESVRIVEKLTSDIIQSVYLNNYVIASDLLLHTNGNFAKNQSHSLGEIIAAIVGGRYNVYTIALPCLPSLQTFSSDQFQPHDFKKCWFEEWPKAIGQIPKSKVKDGERLLCLDQYVFSPFYYKPLSDLYVNDAFDQHFIETHSSLIQRLSSNAQSKMQTIVHFPKWLLNACVLQDNLISRMINKLYRIINVN